MPFPTKRTEKLVQEVLSRISNGQPLAQICRDEHMPTPQAWRDWCGDDEALSIAYARARDDGFDFIAAEVLTIAEEVPERTATAFGDKVDPGFVQHQRNRIDTRLKLLAKWDPKRYGERIDHTSSDGSMSPPSLSDMYRSLSGNAGNA